MSRLVVHPHTDTIYHACFSQDHQRIATCGADKTLQVKIYHISTTGYQDTYINKIYILHIN